MDPLDTFASDTVVKPVTSYLTLDKSVGVGQEKHHDEAYLWKLMVFYSFQHLGNLWGSFLLVWVYFIACWSPKNEPTDPGSYHLPYKPY